MKYNDTIYKAAALANQESCREAVISKKPYGRLFTTTAGDLRYDYGRWCKKFFGRMCTFDESFYGMSHDEVIETIRRGSKNDTVFIEFSYKEIGRSEEYFVEQCKALDWDKTKIDREVLNVWCNSSENSPFQQSDLDKVFEHVKAPIANLTLCNYYHLEVYSEFDWTMPVLLGGDVASGSSLDNTTLTVADPYTFKTLAHLKCNSIDPLEYGDVVSELMIKFLPKSVFFCERNNNGKDTLTYMIKLHPELKPRIYGEMKEKVVDKEVKDPRIDTHKTKAKVKKFEYGIDTNTKTRPQMIDLLFHIVKEEPEVFVSKHMHDDLSGMERKNTGKIEHSDASYDDSVFSYLMFRWTWVYGTNMQQYYLGNYTRSDKDRYTDDSAQNELSKINNIARLNMATTFSQNETLKEFQRYQDIIDTKERGKADTMMNFIMSLNK